MEILLYTSEIYNVQNTTHILPTIVFLFSYQYQDVHCFDLSGESEANEVTVASFNPMLEFMTSHSQSSSTSISSGDDGEEDIGNEEGTASVVNNNTTSGNTINPLDYQGSSSHTKKMIKDSFPSKHHLNNNSSVGSESPRPHSSIVNGNAVVGVGPNNHFEFVVEKIFTDYKNLFQKEYKDPKEHVKRKDIFRHNLR